MNIPDIQEIYPVDEQGNPTIQPPPNPEIQLQVSEEQRKTLESKARIEINSAEAASKMDVDRAMVMKTMADVGMMQHDAMIAEYEAMTARMKVRQEGLSKILEVEDNERDRQTQERTAKAKQGSKD